MTMIFSGTELEEVRFNGVACEEVYFNGVLVFEEDAGDTVDIITLKDSEDTQEWGLFIESIQTEPFGSRVHLTWGWSAVPSNGWIRMYSVYPSHVDRVRVTIGGIVRVLNKNTAGANWGLVQTPAQYNELPKSGTHILKLVEVL